MMRVLFPEFFFFETDGVYSFVISGVSKLKLRAPSHQAPCPALKMVSPVCEYIDELAGATVAIEPSFKFFFPHHLIPIHFYNQNFQGRFSRVTVQFDLVILRY